MVFVGSFTSPTKFYVSVNQVKYLCDTATEALDLAFKVFAIINCPFSKSSWNVWLLIKKVVYKISSKEKSSVPLQKAITFIEQHLNLKIV